MTAPTAPETETDLGRRRCWPRPSRRWAARSGPARSRWPRRSPTPWSSGNHLLVQAGTGTGKSLAYLVPALLHDSRVVVATATLALQHQLVERDLPRLVEAVGDLPGVDASYAVLKGRSNYACLHRIREGVPDDQGALVEVPQGSMATKVLELRAWAEEEAEGKRQRRARQRAAAHRPRVAPGLGQPPRVPRRLEVPVRPGVLRRAGPREGPALPPDRHQPLAARDRRDRGRADDPRLRRRGRRRGARAGRPGSPRPPPTSCSPADVDRAAKRSQRHVDGSEADDLADAGDALRAAIDDLDPGRIDTLPDALGDALVSVRTSARACLSAYPKGGDQAPGDGDAGLNQAKGAVQEVFATAERMAAHAESRRALGDRGRRPPPAAPVRRAAPGLGADARQAAHRQAGGLHQRDAAAGRRLRRRGVELRAQAVGERRGQRGRARRRRPARGAGSTSAARSTTASRRSSTSPATCRRPAATGSARPSSTRSSSWSTPARAGPSGSSPAGGPPRPRRSPSASGCRT